MPDIGVSVQTDGSISKVTEISVVDENKTVKKVIEAFVYDNGEFKRFWPMQGSAELFNVQSYLGVAPFSQAQVTWSTTFMETITVSNGTATYTTDIEDDSYLFTNLTPSTVYTFTLSGKDQNGNNLTLQTATYKTAPVTKPTNLTVEFIQQGDTFITALNWDTIAGATGYTISTLGFNQENITTSNYQLFLSNNTTSTVQVYTEYGSYKSEPATVTFTVPTVSAPSGVYTFKPSSNYSWSDAKNAWRAQSDKLYHGKGNTTFGVQASYFFGYKDSSGREPTNLYYKDANVTKVEIYLKRDSDTGDSTAVSNRFKTHSYVTKPPTSPTATNGVNEGTLAPSGSGWFTIYNTADPARDDSTRAKFAGLLDGSIYGYVWGDTDPRFMASSDTAAANLTRATPVGTVRLTIV